MKILVVGNGAREHIIVEKLAKDSTVLAVMGKKNPAIAKLCEDSYVCDIMDPKEVKAWASGKNIDIAFVSPDAVLGAGMSDAIAELGIKVVSPMKRVADIECDKKFARQLMKDHNIPGMIKYHLVNSEEEARNALLEFGNVAIKPIGLTGGKGVKVSGDHFQTKEDAMKYVNELLEKDGQLLIEEKLIGEEFTLQAFSDGEHLAFMPPVQDHKRAFEQEKGPNTGGMGSYSTGELLPFMNKEDLERAKTAMQKTIEALKKERAEFKGILYGQFMLTKDGPKIIEYNARFGDPEAMNVLYLLESSLTELFTQMAEGNLKDAKFKNDATVVKYFVPDGYPDDPKGDQMVDLDEDIIREKGCSVYYASVYEKEGKIYTTSSRSFGIVGMAKELKDAEQKVQSAMGSVKGPVWYRKDIGTQELVQKRIDHMKEIRG